MGRASRSRRRSKRQCAYESKARSRRTRRPRRSRRRRRGGGRFASKALRTMRPFGKKVGRFATKHAVAGTAAGTAVLAFPAGIAVGRRSKKNKEPVPVKIEAADTDELQDESPAKGDQENPGAKKR